MTWEKFWSIIDRVRAKADMQDEASVKQFLYTELIKLPQDELLGFDCVWQSYRNKANFPKMVAAACIINDGSSDDRFTDFRNWLIMQGYDAYRQALIDPDNLAALNIPFRDTEWMGCGNVAWYAYAGQKLHTYFEKEGIAAKLFRKYPALLKSSADLHQAIMQEQLVPHRAPETEWERQMLRTEVKHYIDTSGLAYSYRIFKQAAGKTAKSILVSVGVRLAAFNLPSIAKLTMTDELHLQELGERKIALFCCIPDSDKSLNYLVGMIYTQLIQTLYRQADRIHKGRLPVPVHCLMDEYANISLPKDTFLSALATMRSRAIFCSIIVQNMAQLKAMYKDDWESLVGLCDEFLYLGGTEKETHKYVSELLGKETISTTSYNQSKGRSGSYSINHQQSGRDLMTPDEVRLLDNSKCILFIRGERPVIDLKYNLLKHPNIRYTEDGGAAPYDYTAADNARDDLPGAPENYELLDMDDFLPAEAAEMKPTIQRIRRST